MAEGMELSDEVMCFASGVEVALVPVDPEFLVAGVGGAEEMPGDGKD